MQKNIKHLISAPNTKSEQTSHLYEPGAFWKEALDKIRKLSMPDDRIVITGSFYTVGAAIQYLN